VRLSYVAIAKPSRLWARIAKRLLDVGRHAADEREPGSTTQTGGQVGSALPLLRRRSLHRPLCRDRLRWRANRGSDLVAKLGGMPAASASSAKAETAARTSSTIWRECLMSASRAS